MYVYAVARIEPYLMVGDGHTSEEALLHNFGNHTIGNTTLCPAMGGLDSQRGATLDVQKICTLTFVVWLFGNAITTNSIALVRHTIQC